ncbi:MAG: 4-hydroxythreonine-4-phosphate dehydrogenase PdxA [bacterium]|nr:4-hydroxythreonine-4-phosphate dehydrogenase PdxA [bacterium]
MARRALLLITMGDPGGVGPEVAVRAVASAAIRKICRPVLVGDPAVFGRCAGAARGRVRLVPVRGVGDARPRGRLVPVVNPCGTVPGHRWGAVRAAHGAAAMACVRYAARAAMEGRADGVVTAPICKEAIHRAGWPFQGHTDYLAALTGAREHAMMLAGRGLRVVLVTVHEPLALVSGMVTRAAVGRSIRLARDACVGFGVRRPRIAVCALNPHAGEGGAFGSEERRAILPAVRAAAAAGIDAAGPFPADTLFTERRRRRFDAVVAMYHDQGLIPLKMLAFDVGVNITLGLPIVRTSPDHGTAFDIAGAGRADPASMMEAIRCAAALCRRR